MDSIEIDYIHLESTPFTKHKLKLYKIAMPSSVLLLGGGGGTLKGQGSVVTRDS